MAKENNQEFRIKFEKFKRDKRAYYSFLILALAFFITLPAELLCNVKPILLILDGKPYFPIFFKYSEKDFGGTQLTEPDYKSAQFEGLLKGVDPKALDLKMDTRTNNEGFDISMDDFDDTEETGLNLGLDDFEDEEDQPIIQQDIKVTTKENSFEIGLDDFEEEGISIDESVSPEIPKSSPNPSNSNIKENREFWMLWPPVRYDYKYIPTDSVTGQVALAAPYKTKTPDGKVTISSSWLDGHYLGTDDRGRDVLARLIYGFRISLIFGVSLAITGTMIGCLLGGIQGFFGGWIDLIGQRLTEIWGSIPRLYILIILSAFLVPSTLLLFAILNLTAWMGIAAYIRAEFLKSRNLEYVKAARALGVSNFSIMRKHILPNSLTPVITFFPFEVTAGILALVSLDYLNLGVPSPSPSIGELLAQGKNNLQADWILLPTFFLLTITITLLTFVGDGIRNAFDPRKSD